MTGTVFVGDVVIGTATTEHGFNSRSPDTRAAQIRWLGSVRCSAGRIIVGWPLIAGGWRVIVDGTILSYAELSLSRPMRYERVTNQTYVTRESERIGRDGVLVDGSAAAQKGIQDCIVG